MSSTFDMRSRRAGTRRLALVTFFAALVALLAAGCEDVVSDPTFRDWCGEQLCAWKVESGQIRKAPTWHKKDFGVELLDPPSGTVTQISQASTKAPSCLELVMVADVDPSAQVVVGLDFNADGVIDHQQPIVSTGFREVKAQVTAPAAYDGIRFTITKKGAGRAVLAQIRVKSVTGCTAPPIVLSDLPLGARCDALAASSCRSGVCCEGLCAECCGARPPGFAEAGADGEPPPLDTTSGRACPGNAECRVRVAFSLGRSLTGPAVPAQCDPGERTHPRGAECLADDDCESGACDGESVEAIGFEGGNAGKPIACSTSFPDAGSKDCFYVLARGGRCR